MSKKIYIGNVPIKGTEGKSAYQSWLDQGNIGTEAEFVESLKGEDGADGKDGKDGAPGPKGSQGNTGSSVDYPYELVNNLTTDDATKGLSAAQGVVLDGEVSQLDGKVTDLDETINGGEEMQTVSATGTRVNIRMPSNGNNWTGSSATGFAIDGFAVIAGKSYHLVVPAMGNSYTAVYEFGTNPNASQVSSGALPDPVKKGPATNAEYDIIIPLGKTALYVCYEVASGSPTLTTTQQTDGLVDRVDTIESAVAEIPGIKEDVEDVESAVSDINNKIGGEIETVVAWDTYSGGTLQLSGQVVYATSTNNVIMVLPVERGKYKSIKATLAHSVDNNGTFAQILMFTDNYSETTSKVKGVAYSNPTTEGVYDYDETIPYNVDYILIFNRAGVLATPTIKVVELTPNSIEGRLEKLENDTTPEHRYMTCVKKPNVLSGKMLYFFGDSITRGYIVGGTISSHNYPKEFSEAIGANYVNYAESGTSLSGTGGIAEKIESTPLASCDLAFVAGGINDWQTGKSEQEIKDAVTDICNYFTNAGKECIFITPINHAGRIPNATPLVTVEQVREIITRIAMSYGFGVVQGWEFPFPDETDDAEYISDMFQDKLHPTDAGYIMYAIALRNAVL